MAIFKTSNGQNIFDIALMTYGDISGAVDLVKDNPHIDFNQDISSGTELTYTPQQNAVVDFVVIKNVTIATDESDATTGGAFDSGFDNSFN